METKIYIHDLYKRMIYPDISELTRSEYYLNTYRRDLTYLDVYTIDPSGSIDADDAFSIEQDESDNDIWFLYVHIADPTSYFSPNDKIFDSIKVNGVSQYPSLSSPRHMFHQKIVDKCSLISGIKPAISILFIIQKDKCIFNKIILSTIYCNPKNRFTYEQAGDVFTNVHNPIHDLFNRVKMITDNMRFTREASNKYNHSYPANIKYDKDTGNIIYIDNTIEIVWAKRMIEELAIQTNFTIAKLLYNSGCSSYIKRHCDSITKEKIYSDNMILDIITNNMRASYDVSNIKHSVLNLQTYCHFTSPLRRFVDCINHFVIKHNLIQNNDSELFTFDELYEYTNLCNIASKKHRQISYKDYKYRMYQYITQRLSTKHIKHVEIKFVHSGIVNGFINAVINQIDRHNVNISYTLRDDKYTRTCPKDTICKKYRAYITVCNLKKQPFDEGILPQLDSFLRK